MVSDVKYQEALDYIKQLKSERNDRQSRLEEAQTEIVNLKAEIEQMRDLLARVQRALAGSEYNPAVFDALARQCKEAAKAAEGKKVEG